MINLYSRRTNTITISDLYSKVTIPDASLHYVFNFVDVYNNEVPAVLVQQNADQTRSSKFYFTDSSDGTIKGSGEYNIYESPIDSSVIDASIMNLLENGQYTYVPETDADLYYDPSLFDYLGHDVVFDPIFGSGDQVPTTVNHDDLIGRDSKSNHPWALAEASLGTQFSWESGLLTVDVSGGSSTKDPSIDDLYSEISDINSYQSIQDSSIAALEASIGNSMDYPYVDGSLLARDASITELYEKSINSINDIPDVSAAGATTNQVLTWTGTYWEPETASVPDVTKSYVDSSLAERDASIEALFVLSETQDPSIADLYQEIEDIPQDPSIISLYDTKQDIITDGTFLKESSIGSGFEWNAGMLDVSAGSGDVSQAYVDGSLGLRDTSIAWLNTNKLEQSDLADYTTFDYVDGSLNAKADLTDIPTDFYSQEYVDGSLNAKADIGDIPTDFYSQEYVDGSLNAKQDLIPDGTFLKEASIGDGLEWNAGQLDVSIVSTDASVQDLYDYVEDLSTYAHTQDASIADLYQEIEDIPQDPSIVDIYDTAMFGITNGLGGDADILSVDAGPSGLAVVKGKSIKAGTGISVFTDAGIDYIEIENIAVPDVDKSYIDANFIPNASIGDGLVWNAGMLDVSVASSGGVSQEYVDGSLATKVNKTDLDTSLGLYVQKAGDTMTGDLTITNKTIIGKVEDYLYVNSPLTVRPETHPSGKVFLINGNRTITLPYDALSGAQYTFINYANYTLTFAADSSCTLVCPQQNTLYGAGSYAVATYFASRDKKWHLSFFDSTTKAVVDALITDVSTVASGAYVKKAGDTMTGDLTITGADIITAVGTRNTRLGDDTMPNNTGADNTAIGYAALNANTIGQQHTAIGEYALRLCTSTGIGNTAIGRAAGNSFVSGSFNTFIGYNNAYYIASGDGNVNIGQHAGSYYGSSTSQNTSASYSLFLGTYTRASANGNSNEIVIGYNALGNGSNTVTLGNTDITKTYLRGEVQIPSALSGKITMNGNLDIKAGTIITSISNNVRLGGNAFTAITSGISNTAIGSEALRYMQTGNENTAIGVIALKDASNCSSNTAVGYASLYTLNTGDYNIAVGRNAGRYEGASTRLLTDSAYGLYLGSNSRASANGNTNEIVIGYNALGNGSNTVTLGNTSVTAGYLGGKEIATKDTSILTKTSNYTVVAADNNDVLEIDASITVTLPNNVNTGFQLTIVNAGTGHVTIDASTIRSVGGAKILKDQYAGASAVHRGAGVWYVWGNLS